MQDAVRGDTHDTNSTGRFDVKVYSEQGMCLRDYSLDAGADHVATIADVERQVRARVRTGIFETLVAVITEETIGGFNQVQLNLEAGAANSA